MLGCSRAGPTFVFSKLYAWDHCLEQKWKNFAFPFYLHWLPYYFLNMSMYLSQSIIPLMNSKFPTPDALTQPHTRTELLPCLNNSTTLVTCSSKFNSLQVFTITSEKSSFMSLLLLCSVYGQVTQWSGRFKAAFSWQLSLIFKTGRLFLLASSGKLTITSKNVEFTVTQENETSKMGLTMAFIFFSKFQLFIPVNLTDETFSPSYLTIIAKFVKNILH